MSTSLIKQHVDSIDGLRGIAILMVVYQHTLATAVGTVLTSDFGLTYPYIVANGWMGVGLFFMLSGFVLALPYFSSVRSLETSADFRGYYRHRALRLFPLFVFMAMVSYLLGLTRGFDYLTSLALVLTTTSMFTVSEFFPRINGSFWSLMVEIWFCVLFPFLIWALMRYRVVFIVLPIMLVAVGLRIAGAYFSFHDVHINPMKDFFVARTDDFLIGMLIACLYARQKLPERFGALMFFGGCAMIVATAVLWDLRMQGILPPFWIACFNNLSQVGFGLVLISVLQPGWPRALLSLWWLRILGAMCFSIYCWHELLITRELKLSPFSLTLQLQFWFLLILLSSLTYRFIEFPHSRSLLKLFRLESPGGHAEPKYTNAS